MRRIQSRAIVLIAMVASFGAVACASSGASAASEGGAGSSSDANAHRTGNVISQSEIEESNTSNALEAIKRLRPNFLVVRGTMSRAKGSQDIGIVVYSNGSKLGATSTLESIPSQEIKQIEYVSPSDATQRFGTGHSHGAIVVTRK